ncbi:MAG: hypothetical protein Q4E24_16135 [bacterium]|nr:hypothetical protein [bacterium]
MKKRIAKKIEKKRREGIHKVLDLVLDVNGLKARQKELTGDKPTAFFSFSGHIAAVMVSVYNAGWATGIEDALNLTHYLGEDYGDSLEKILQKLTEVANGL